MANGYDIGGGVGDNRATLQIGLFRGCELAVFAAREHHAVTFGAEEFFQPLRDVEREDFLLQAQ